MKFGYTRVSKNDQSLDVQLEKLTADGCEEIFKEQYLEPRMVDLN